MKLLALFLALLVATTADGSLLVLPDFLPSAVSSTGEVVGVRQSDQWPVYWSSGLGTQVLNRQPSSLRSYPTGINALGVIVGVSEFDLTPCQRPIYWLNGSIYPIQLPVLNHLETAVPSAIVDSGWVCLTASHHYYDQRYSRWRYLTKAVRYQSVGAVGMVAPFYPFLASTARTILKDGTVGGTVDDRFDERFMGMVWFSDDRVESVIMGEHETVVSALSEDGELAGWYDWGEHRRAFILDDGNGGDIGQPLLAREARPVGFGSDGRLYGTALLDSYQTRPFYYHQGSGFVFMSMLGGVELISVTAVTGRYVVGTARIDGRLIGYRLDTVAEPPTLLVLLAGTFLLAGARFARR